MSARSPEKFETSKHSHPSLKIRPHASYEVVPDSEEERQQNEAEEQGSGHSAQVIEVIEISSDELDSDEEVIKSLGLNRPSKVTSQTPRKAGNKPNYSLRRIIESSDEASGPEIIEVSDSSGEDAPVKPSKKGLKAPVVSSPSPTRVGVDESIIIFDEPRSARTPLRVGTKRNNDDSSRKPKEDVAKINKSSTSLFGTPDSSNKKIATPVSRRQTEKTSQVTPRPNSKKAQLEAELKRRKEYAQQLFMDLNMLVFKEGLPRDTQLNWNKRLLTTAGRAKYHRSREGVQTTEIELAEKILDCDERIRNTLSHEMCHLATWVIDNKIDEHHGKLFKNWASLVMKKRPDIHVSIKHDYEISYPYQWKCEKCAKIYGRFSKSIRPDECVCGACKEGKLIPLFTTRIPTNKTTKKQSRMAAAKPQDSPRSTQDTASKNHVPSEGSESEDFEIEILTDIFASTTIGK